MDIYASLKSRYGFQTRGMRALAAAVRPFFQCRCSVPPTILERNEPVVFVCNHYEIFGPVAIVLSLPLRYRLWASSHVVSPRENIDRLIVGTQHVFPFLSDKGARRLMEMLAPAAERVMGRFQPIPVYPDNLGRQMASIRESVDSLLKGDHIVLFPETAIPAYSHGSVTEFYRNFALIGEYYRRQTGGSAAFCPIYVDKKHRRLQFGDLVYYGSEKPGAECERIVTQLRGQLLEMSRQALGQPRRISS